MSIVKHILTVTNRLDATGTGICRFVKKTGFALFAAAAFFNQ
jgi:hypothetical protein